ncbi:hypothetical protein HK102_000038 [Quaeritorhiza haematococci]|nr:hypothetical protein HK102_000038 [Quaeritorhiza haematococci]
MWQGQYLKDGDSAIDFKYLALPKCKDVLNQAARNPRSRVTNAILRELSDPDIRILTLANSHVTGEELRKRLPVTLLSDVQFVEEDGQPRDINEDSATSDSWEELADEEGFNLERMESIHTLNVAYCKTLGSPVSFALLLSQSLPLLYSLDISGCFDFEKGVSALSILAKGLINLHYLNVSETPWLTDKILLGLPWYQHLRYLDTLVLQNCPQLNEEEIQATLKNRAASQQRTVLDAAARRQLQAQYLDQLEVDDPNHANTVEPDYSISRKRRTYYDYEEEEEPGRSQLYLLPCF